MEPSGALAWQRGQGETTWIAAQAALFRRPRQAPNAEDDPQDRDDQQSEAGTMMPGDSVAASEASDEEPEEARKQEPEPEEPAAGTGMPRVNRVQAPELPSRGDQAGANSGGDRAEGNISWYFGNFGPVPKDAAAKARLALQIRKCPGTVVGLAECSKQVQDWLQEAGTPAPADSAAAGAPPGRGPAGSAAAVPPTQEDRDELERRPKSEFIAIRGLEDYGLLVAARASTCRALDLIRCEKCHGLSGCRRAARRERSPISGSSSTGPSSGLAWPTACVHWPADDCPNDAIVRRSQGFGNENDCASRWCAQCLSQPGRQGMIGWPAGRPGGRAGGLLSEWVANRRVHE